MDNLTDNELSRPLLAQTPSKRRLFLKNCKNNCAHYVNNVIKTYGAFIPINLAIYCLLTIFTAIALVIYFNTSNIPGRDLYPTSSYIITKNHALLPIGNEFLIDSYDCTNITTYQNYLNKITEVIKEHEQYQKANEQNSECDYYNYESMENCAVLPYGFDKGVPCTYLIIPKMFNYSPQPLGNSKTINVICYQINKNGEVKYLDTHPKGFPTTYFPYNPLSKCPQPIVSVQLNASKETELRCVLQVKGIDEDNQYDATRAKGRVSIVFKGVQNSDKC